VTFLKRLFGGSSDERPDLDGLTLGDELVSAGEAWRVRAIIHYRMEDNEWPSVQLEREGRTIWIAYEEDALVRYDPAPDLHLGADGAVAWQGRLYRMEDAGTATVARVTGPVEVSPGDRVSYHTLTSPDDADGWLSVETWESGWVEISIGRTFTASHRPPGGRA
jgi:uncharacterized protein DUF4178